MWCSPLLTARYFWCQKIFCICRLVEEDKLPVNLVEVGSLSIRSLVREDITPQPLNFVNILRFLISTQIS